MIAKKIIFVCSLLFLTFSCSFFKSDEMLAIEICQDTNILEEDLGSFGFNKKATWSDFTNKQAEEQPNDKYEWKSQKTETKNMYIVSIVDKEGRGYFFDVDIKNKIVKRMASDEYLGRKFGLSSFDSNAPFEVSSIEIDTLIYNDHLRNDINYSLKASIVNKTGVSLTHADLSGEVNILYKDKSIKTKCKRWLGNFYQRISRSKPWKPDTERIFYIESEDMDGIYLQYKPEYMYFLLMIEANNPIGYSYDGAIYEEDLITKWETIKD